MPSPQANAQPASSSPPAQSDTASHSADAATSLPSSQTKTAGSQRVAAHSVKASPGVAQAGVSVAPQAWPQGLAKTSSPAAQSQAATQAKKAAQGPPISRGKPRPNAACPSDAQERTPHSAGAPPKMNSLWQSKVSQPSVLVSVAPLVSDPPPPSPVSAAVSAAVSAIASESVSAGSVSAGSVSPLPAPLSSTAVSVADPSATSAASVTDAPVSPPPLPSSDDFVSASSPHAASNITAANPLHFAAPITTSNCSTPDRLPLIPARGQRPTADAGCPHRPTSVSPTHLPRESSCL